MKTVTAKALKRMRLKMGYSIAEMAELLALPKSTCQCYENGSRSIPDAVLAEAQAAYERDRAFFDRFKPGGSFDKMLAEEYPNGIPPENLIDKSVKRE